jgi:putative endonuclease
LNLFSLLCRLADAVRFRSHRDTGRRGEDLAHRYLRDRGLLVVARNWRPPQGGGEVDIIACESAPGGDILVFVEVKARVSGELSAPERNIDADKITALRRAARDYVRRARADTERIRFDVISVTGEKIEHFRDAFSPH